MMEVMRYHIYYRFSRQHGFT